LSDTAKFRLCFYLSLFHLHLENSRFILERYSCINNFFGSLGSF